MLPLLGAAATTACAAGLHHIHAPLCIMIHKHPSMQLQSYPRGILRCEVCCQDCCQDSSCVQRRPAEMRDMPLALLCVFRAAACLSILGPSWAMTCRRNRHCREPASASALRRTAASMQADTSDGFRRAPLSPLDFELCVCAPSHWSLWLHRRSQSCEKCFPRLASNCSSHTYVLWQGAVRLVTRSLT